MNLSQEKKYLFAAYANMAYDNFHDVITFIIKSNDKPYSNNNIIESLLELIKSDDRLLSERVTRSITKSFPFTVCFIDCIKEKNSDLSVQDIICDILINIHDNLTNWRNYTTHYTHNEFENKGSHDLSFCNLLTYTYELGLTRVKKRFNITDEKEIAHLDLRQDNCYYKLSGSNDTLSEKGIAYFLCLFLYKRDAYSFLRQFSGFKKSTGTPYRLTLEQFTVMRFNATKKIGRAHV